MFAFVSFNIYSGKRKLRFCYQQESCSEFGKNSYLSILEMSLRKHEVNSFQNTFKLICFHSLSCFHLVDAQQLSFELYYEHVWFNIFGNWTLRNGVKYPTLFLLLRFKLSSIFYHYLLVIDSSSLLASLPNKIQLLVMMVSFPFLLLDLNQTPNKDNSFVIIALVYLTLFPFHSMTSIKHAPYVLLSLCPSLRGPTAELCLVHYFTK